MRQGIQGRVNRDPQRLRKCGGKKFLYVKESEINKDVFEEKSIEQIAGDSKEEVLEIIEPKVRGKAKKEVEMFDRVETIRIVGPGSYEAQYRQDGKERREDRECGRRRGQLHHRSHVHGKGHTKEEEVKEAVNIPVIFH